MKTVEILNRVNRAAAAIPAAYAPDASAELAALVRALEDQIRIEAAAAVGRSSAAKTLKRILQSNAAWKTAQGDALAYPWTDDAGRQIVADPFRVFRLADPLPLPERPASAPDPNRLERFFPETVDGWHYCKVPSASEIRASIDLQRAAWTGKRQDFRPLYRLPGEDSPTVNAQYLADAVAVFPDAAEAYWVNRYGLVYIGCAAGDCLIMPVMPRTARAA